MLIIQHFKKMVCKIFTFSFLRAEVYSAMAESLGLAWKDLNHLLEQRKNILDQNYLFQGHFQVMRKNVDCIKIYLKESVCNC